MKQSMQSANLSNGSVHNYNLNTDKVSRSHLLRQLFFTQFVQHIELLCQKNVVNESTTGQLHSDDDLKDLAL